MPKSKFQIKANESIRKKATQPKGRPKYYDEDLPKKAKSNMAYGVFVIIMVISAVTIIGIQANNEKKAKEEAEAAVAVRR